MARSSPILSTFNAGEFDKTLEGRVDLAKYAQGCKVLENFLPLVQGPAQRRGGFRFVQEVKDSGDRVWVRKFEFSATQAYQLEFGDLYVRFYALHGVVLDGIAVYEIVSPYNVADLTNADGTCALSISQSGDVLYIANAMRTYKVQKLTRVTETSWTFTDYAPDTGPFIEQNDTATTLYASAQTGSVTLQSSTDIFSSTDIGRLVRLDPQNLDIHPWEQGKAYAINDLARFDGKTYKALNAKTAATTPPIHEEGNAYDGQDGVQWAFQDAGYGIARITAFTDANTVTATVIKQLPSSVVGSGNATKRWALGAWSTTTEYPAVVTQFRNRLALGGKLRYWLSVPQDFNDMSGDIFGQTTTDCAIWGILQAEDVNNILWMMESEKLLIGTPGGEFALGEITTSDPLGPDNVKVVRQTKRRSRSVTPVIVDTAVIFIQRAGRRMLGLDFDVTIDRFKSQDLAVLAKHITRSGIIDMAYQAEPDSLIWCVLGNGGLVALTLDQEQNVIGWHRHPIGGSGIVESVSVIPAPDGARDEVWICVRRTINGVTKRYVEFLEPPYEEGDDQDSVFYVDSGLTYDGVATTTITGLSHLEGETVQVVADGASHPNRTVSAGAIALARSASVVHVGLACPARLVSMRIESGSQDGTAQGKMKRAHQLVVRLLDTLGGKCGLYGQPLTEIQFRTPSMPMDEPPTIATSIDKVVDVGGDYERDLRIEVRQDQPFPMTVAAIMPRMRTYEN
jgi:hypothetical protein